MARILLRRVLLPLLCLAAFGPGPARAQWVQNGTAVTTATQSQSSPAIVSDGADGSIIAWQDDRTGVADIYVQRVDAHGFPQWTANGVAVCTAPNAQFNPQLVGDGSGGAIVVWQDHRFGNPDIYAQRIDAAGVPQWTADGVPLTTLLTEQSLPRIATDGAGGAFVSWQDLRSGAYDIYGQRVNGAGVPQWAANGIALSAATDHQSNHRMIAGAVGDAIIVWQDHRWGQYDIYGQRVLASGQLWWTSNGIWVCTATGTQMNPTIAPDGTGGALITWEDWRVGAEIYAQRMNAAGGPMWTVDGVPVVTAVSIDLEGPVIASDGVQGAIVAWTDLRTGSGQTIHAQRLNNVGTPLWTVNGIVVAGSGGQGNPRDPRIVPDPSGGAVVGFVKGSGFEDIYAQKLTASGTLPWSANGVPICTASGAQTLPDLVADGRGGAILAWQDTRTGSADIHAQRIQALGYWGHPEPVLASVTDVPMDQGGRVGVDWLASGADASGLNTITQYSLWRQASPAPAGMSEGLAQSEPAAIGEGFPGSGYRVVTDPNGTATTWEFIVSLPARYAAEYRYTATTLADSIAGNPADETYQVLAHTTSAFVFFESNTLAGHSVDNLAPAAPLALAAAREGADVRLHWERVTSSDLRDYAVYRANSPGVAPAPENFVANTTDTVLVDANPPGGPLYYVATTYDVHGNQSAASNEAIVSGVTGVGAGPSIAQLTVLPNHPNPLSSVTTFRLGLPAPTDVAIELFDTSGRRVAHRRVAGLHAGWQLVSVEARDDDSRPLASGVYTCRFTTAGGSVARKVMVVR